MSRTVKDLPIELRQVRRERAEKERTRVRRRVREQRSVLVELRRPEPELPEAA